MVTGDAVCQPLNPCLNGGQCHPLPGDYYCDCPLNTAGRNCERSTCHVQDVSHHACNV